MCGQFNLSKTADEKLKALAKAYQPYIPDYPCRIVKPNGVAPLVLGKDKLFLCARWGLRCNGKFLINIRYESLKEKSMFKSIADNRCVTACDFFREKDPNGNLFDLRVPYGEMFLGCILSNSTSEPLFSVLTCEALQTHSIHPRIPLVIPREALSDWLDGAPTSFSPPTFSVTPSHAQQLNFFNQLE